MAGPPPPPQNWLDESPDDWSTQASPGQLGSGQTSPVAPSEPAPALGAPNAGAENRGAAAVESLRGELPDDAPEELRELHRRVQRRRRQNLLLTAGAAATVLLGVAIAGGAYLVSVYRYAAVGPEIAVRRDGVDPGRLVISYVPESTGLIGFRRRAVDRTTELLDRVVADSLGQAQAFHWSVGRAADASAVEIVYRRGWSIVTEPLRLGRNTSRGPVGEHRLTGQIVDATNNRPVADATVRVPGTSLSAATDADGRFVLEGLGGGPVPLEVSAPGFTTDRFEQRIRPGRANRARVALSPGLEAGQIRIVLTWDGPPEDLDAHLEGPLPGDERFHVYYHEPGDLKSRQFVRLDVDDRDGQGPETITVLGVLPGEYRFFVHDYTNRDKPKSTALAHSGAEVRVYHGGQTYRFRAGHDAPGNIWNVCNIRVTPEGAEVVRVDRYEGSQGEKLGLYAKRTMGNREAWIGRLGGSATSEEAVAAGLAWLARHQHPEGYWSSTCLGPKSQHADSQCRQDAPCAGAGKPYEMALTGLSVLAFQAGGYYADNNREYSENVRRGLEWMVANQGPEGQLVGSMRPMLDQKYHKNYMYEHGIAAFALCEANAVAVASHEAPNPRYYRGAKRAVDFIFSQQHDDGGWRYTDEFARPSDTSVTGWQVLALKSAMEAGIEVPEPVIDRIRRLFRRRETGQDGRTGYLNRHVNTDATTAIGMLVHQFLLGTPESSLVRAAAPYMAEQAENQWPKPAAIDKPDYYLWYNGTLAMFQAGGEPWEQWNRRVRDAIIGLQRTEGCERGSWDPDSRWGRQGGRIYTTALAALTLEVYYRYTAADEMFDDLEFEVIGTEAEAAPEPGEAELPLRGDR